MSDRIRSKCSVQLDHTVISRLADCADRHACEVLQSSLEFSRALIRGEVKDVIEWHEVDLENELGIEGRLQGKVQPFEDFLQTHGRVTTKDFLCIAAAMTSIAGHIHDLGYLHNNIQAASFVVDPATLCLRMMCYDCASYEPVLRPTPQEPVPGISVLSAAPETSGRLPFPTDRRSDLYSLGVLFHRVLTGSLPYDGESAARILHGHIAGRPKIADDESVPSTLRALVGRLLQKDPARRYQTADSLTYDLARLTELLDSSGSLEMSLGTLDQLARVNVPELSQDRAREMEGMRSLLQGLRADHKNRVVSIAGPSGSGKSTLAEQCTAVAREVQTNFATLKFNASLDVSSFASLKLLAGQLVSGDNSSIGTNIADTRSVLTELLGEDAPFLCELVPELAARLDIGGDSHHTVSSYRIAPVALEARLCAAFVRLIRAFAQDSAPLFLYL